MSCNIFFSDEYILEDLIENIHYFKNANKNNLEDMIKSFIEKNDEEFIKDNFNKCSFEYLIVTSKNNNFKFSTVEYSNDNIGFSTNIFKDPNDILDFGNICFDIEALLNDCCPKLIICKY